MHHYGQSALSSILGSFGAPATGFGAAAQTTGFGGGAATTGFGAAPSTGGFGAAPASTGFGGGKLFNFSAVPHFTPVKRLLIDGVCSLCLLVV